MVDERICRMSIINELLSKSVFIASLCKKMKFRIYYKKALNPSQLEAVNFKKAHFLSSQEREAERPER